MNPIELYLSKQKPQPLLFDTEVNRNLEFIVVIPCYNENDIDPCLVSLETAAIQAGVVIEILIVINDAVHSTAEVKIQNSKMYSWLSGRSGQFPLLITYLNSIPDKQAGVGYARKAGMDAAVVRFAHIHQFHGIICSMDADTRVATGYFAELKRAAIKKNWECLILYYEHDWSMIPDPRQVKAIVDYELHLRYYVAAQHYAGFPFAYQTLGSAFAVRALAYALAGGMPPRQAGEDFYFIQKFSKRNTVANLCSTVVYPSARISDRVPFGTGKALSDAMTHSEGAFRTYAWQSFVDLKPLLDNLELVYLNSDLSKLDLSRGVSDFLQHIDLDSRLAEIKQHTRSYSTFHKRFFNVMDAFMMMKYVHFMRDRWYKNDLLIEACNHLLNRIEPGIQPIRDATALLTKFRQLDRTNGL